jgi:hypothetical protein
MQDLYFYMAMAIHFFRFANEEHLTLLVKGREALYEDESTMFDSQE